MHFFRADSKIFPSKFFLCTSFVQIRKSFPQNFSYALLSCRFENLSLKIFPMHFFRADSKIFPSKFFLCTSFVQIRKSAIFSLSGIRRTIRQCFIHAFASKLSTHVRITSYLHFSKLTLKLFQKSVVIFVKQTHVVDFIF